MPRILQVPSIATRAEVQPNDRPWFLIIILFSQAFFIAHSQDAFFSIYNLIDNTSKPCSNDFLGHFPLSTLLFPSSSAASHNSIRKAQSWRRKLLVLLGKSWFSLTFFPLQKIDQSIFQRSSSRVQMIRAIGVLATRIRRFFKGTDAGAINRKLPSVLESLDRGTSTISVSTSTCEKAVEYKLL